MTSPTAHHVGTTVSDLDRAVAFYREVFDIEVVSRFSVAGEGFETGVGVPGAAADFAHLDADGVRVELVEYDPTGEDCGADQVNQRGAKHLGFAVSDLEAFYDDLPAEVETLSEPQTTASGTTICFLRDPDGNLIEVIES